MDKSLLNVHSLYLVWVTEEVATPTYPSLAALPPYSLAVSRINRHTDILDVIMTNNRVNANGTSIGNGSGISDFPDFTA